MLEKRIGSEPDSFFWLEGAGAEHGEDDGNVRWRAGEDGRGDERGTVGVGVGYPAVAIDDDGAGGVVFDGAGAVNAKAVG